MIRLEYFDKNDFKQLIDWVSSEELMVNWSGNLFRFPLSENSLDWYIEDTNVLPASEAYNYKAIDDDGTIVGHISLGAISEKNKAARISRVFVAQEHQGKGICYQMAKQLLKIGFEELKLHRISLGVYDTNAAAIKCYEKAGLKIEGIHRDVLLHKDVYWTIIEMSILEDEWRALNA